MKILGIAGSLAKGSFNRKVLLNAGEFFPADVTFELWDGLGLVPPYNADVDVEPVPEAAQALREAVAGADAILFATPEYNASIPGQLKNAIDWASRPFGASSLRGKPVAVVGATTGQFGAVWAQEELRKVLGTAGARVLEHGVAVGLASSQFDADGKLVDNELREGLAVVVEALVEEARLSLVSVG